MKHLSDDDMKNYVQNQQASWPKAGDRYRHYKGGEYEVVVSAVLEDTLTPCVVYRSLKYGTTWVRTLANWQEQVQVDGNSVPRFTKMG